MKKILFVVFGLILTGAAAHATPTLYGFQAITSNSVIDPFIGQSQLSLSVDSYGIGQVLFSFSNSGPSACSITDIYIEDGILGLSGILNGPGVSFSAGASPSNLPGGNVIDFNANKDLSVDSDSPIQSKGVNPGETLGLVFNVLYGNTYDDVIDYLNLGIGATSDVTGDIRVGIHVQAFADGQSEAFVLTPPNDPPVVPAPSAVLLAGIGASCVLKIRRFWL